MEFVITTQFLENYGAHCESGKFDDGNAYWKFKSGTNYLVTGLDRIQDAVAFVAALRMQNSLGAKEFPVEWCTYEEWVAKLPEDEDYREFLLMQVQRVDPNNLIKGLTNT